MSDVLLRATRKAGKSLLRTRKILMLTAYCWVIRAQPLCSKIISTLPSPALGDPYVVHPNLSINPSSHIKYIYIFPPFPFNATIYCGCYHVQRVNFFTNFALENMKTKTKVTYLSIIEENFNTGLAAQTAQQKSRTTQSPLMQDWVHTKVAE